MPHLRVAVVGGGVSGLAAAHRLRQLLPGAELRLFEASERLGGPLDTQLLGNVLIERGADSFLTREPWAVDLCRELGLEGELVPTNTEHRRALVVCRGRLERVPDGFVLMQPHNLGAVLRSPILNWRGKLRLLAEPLVHAPAAALLPDHDESVASFATRRLGREAYERLVQPLLAGIYVADATQLSLAATMPEFLAAEREFGSLRAARRAGARGTAKPTDGSSPFPSPPHRGVGAGEAHASGARYGAFVTLARGMGNLIDALEASLPSGCLRLATPVVQLTKTNAGQWLVATTNGAAESFDGVILAAPAARAALLVEQLDPKLGTALAQIRAANSAVATLVYAPEQIARPLDGFGFVVPQVEQRPILAASFPSVKFPQRNSAGLTPVRVFFGGALQPEMVDRSDEELIAIAHRELAELIGVSGAPRASVVARWAESMPQYRVGHLSLIGEIERRVAAHHGLAIAGASYRGVGIPQCIHSGRAAAESVAKQLAPSP